MSVVCQVVALSRFLSFFRYQNLAAFKPTDGICALALHSFFIPGCFRATHRCIQPVLPMTFLARKSTYRIESAPTGRARCRRCCKAVPKGDLRVAITAFVRPGRSTVLFRCARPACIDAAFVNAVLAIYGSPDAVPAANVVPAEAQRVRAMFSMS